MDSEPGRTGTIRVEVLGDLRARTGAGPCTVGGPRSRDLLASLLVRTGQSVDPALLLDLVWEDASLGVAVVHTQVARLRRAVDAELVHTTGLGYRIGPVVTDADEFESLARQATEAGEAEHAVRLLRTALGLWRGGTAFTGVRPELVAPEITRLDDRRQSAQERLAEVLLQLPDVAAHQESLALARLLIEREPLRERGYELAMLAADRLGRQADGLDHFDLLRTRLRDELGIDPGGSARLLHQRLLHQLPLNATIPAAPQVTGAAPLRPPIATTPLVGREQELARLRQLVVDRPLVTLVGPGGVGKTRLLTELGSVLADVGDVEVGYVELADVHGGEQPTAIALALARCLGLRVDDTDPRTLARALQDRDLVLLLDEAEHCPDALVRALDALLPYCPGLRCVTSSRRPLGAVGEVVCTVRPLPCPGPLATPATIASSPAVQLLVERLADLDEDWVHSGESWTDLATLARRVDGLPLALELMAAQLASRSLRSVDDLQRDPLALKADETDRPSRHRSLRETLEWSVHRLDPAQRAVLARLSVFTGPFGLPAARAVAGAPDGPEVDVAEVVRSLVRDALVHVERTRQGLRVRLLRTIRDLAQLELRTADELAATKERHRRWHADRWRGALRSDALLTEVREHHSDYVEALRDSLVRRDADSAGSLLLALGRFWVFTDQRAVASSWSDRVLTADLLTPLARARVLVLLATVHLHHDPASARGQLSEAVITLREHEETIWLTGALGAMALLAHGAGDASQACRWAEEAVTVSRLTTPERQADALGILAVTAAIPRPDLSEAAALESWELALGSHSAAAIASVGNNVAWSAFTRDDMPTGIAVVEQAVARQPAGSVPLFLRIQQAWALLLSGDGPAAAAGFGRVAMVPTTPVEDLWTAEVMLGAALAQASTGHPETPTLVAGAAALVGRTGMVLTPWQQRLLTEANEAAAELGGPRWGMLSLPALHRLVVETTQHRADEATT